MVNDLSYFLITESILYADDTTFFNCSPDLSALQHLTEDTLTQAFQRIK